MLHLIENYNTFAIYGAQVVAYGAFTAIRHLLKLLPECFIVTNPAGNPGEIEGIPVRTLDTVSKDTLIIIAVTELLQDEIAAALRAQGYSHSFRLTQHEEHLLMSAYFESIRRFPVLDPRRVHPPADLVMFEVRNDRDKPLSKPSCLLDFECPIQAGAALTQKRIAAVLDHTGNNISEKNKQYCEMTAAYWVWKNTSSSWVGLEHYRRHLLVTPENLSADIDAVLPLPYIAYPNVTAQFRRFVSEDVYHALLTALKALHPDQYERYLQILGGQYQYTYNLLCAKREVFDQYCRWFFDITAYMENLVEQVPEIASTRALSYVAEVLTNLYFMSNETGLRIKHAEKAIYV